jgi:hypothetical protein
MQLPVDIGGTLLILSLLKKCIDMKRIFLFFTLVFLTCFGNAAKAQMDMGFNIGLQPLWGPVGYDYVQYYYIPDLDLYYDVVHREYVALDEFGQWSPMPVLPLQYRNIDLFSLHKEVINQRTPWVHHDKHKNRYSKYRGRNDQQMIRDSHEERYWQIQDHPFHSQWHADPENDMDDQHKLPRR